MIIEKVSLMCRTLEDIADRGNPDMVDEEYLSSLPYSTLINIIITDTVKAREVLKECGL
jgi:hypothetical protein